jgi:hypothetical protein
MTGMAMLGAVFCLSLFLADVLFVHRLIFGRTLRLWLDRLDKVNRPLAFMVIWSNSGILFGTSVQFFYFLGAGPGVTLETAVGWALVTAIAFAGFEGGWFLFRRH